MQLARLMARGLTEGDAEARLAAQMPADEKAARADYVIRTDGTFARDRRAQVDRASSGFYFSHVLRRRDPLFDERIPVVTVRALPEQLRAAVAAAHADVRVEVEHGVLGQLAVAIDERRSGGGAGRARARWPGEC